MGAGHRVRSEERCRDGRLSRRISVISLGGCNNTMEWDGEKH